ncbi:hypothetical protein AVEN_229965-1 [Araneus ventricosus]|uniref:Uncharacterized protein n=1 Tax=Araneus ventricosus TaxID=182803 RepID=A0A4Y2BW99_ARAVE|nr:hypothetical protein AVEN_229965-1 [Araneus ventricosus]
MAGPSAAERNSKSRAGQSETKKLEDKIKAKNGMRALRLKREGDKKLKKKKENEATKLRMQKMRVKKKVSLLRANTQLLEHIHHHKH